MIPGKFPHNNGEGSVGTLQKKIKKQFQLVSWEVFKLQKNAYSVTSSTPMKNQAAQYSAVLLYQN